MNAEGLLSLAAAYAKQTAPDIRNFRLGAIGIRGDGAAVFARNGTGIAPTPNVHAEARLCRKLDLNANVYVARILHAGDKWAMAKPCPACLTRLAAKDVKRIFYTISPGEFGCLILKR